MYKFNIQKHETGFYHVTPTPSEQDLNKFYAEEYYQECKNSSYNKEYDSEEKEYFFNRGLITETIVNSAITPKEKTLLDVGCGEGFFLDYFAKKDWLVQGCDFSSYGIQKQNPSLMPSFTQGNLFDILQSLSQAEKTYDLINLAHVLEHASHPMESLLLIKQIMHQSSLLRIVVPNDYSNLQKLLLAKGHIDHETWFTPPAHLNYFTFVSLKKFLSQEFDIVTILADFPVELYLFNENSNYWKDRNKGKKAHKARIEIDNFLVSQGTEKYIRYMETAADCNFGRSITAFVKNKTNKT
ncbi:MAG: methyltransferase domain-containing protein [bacterium]